MKKGIAIVVLLAVCAVGIFSGYGLSQPKARPATGDSGFEAVLQDIAEITVVPHTAGSPENAVVRDMIVQRATTLGLTAEVLPFELDVPARVASQMESYDNGSALYRQRMENYTREGNFASLEEMYRGRLNAGTEDVLYLDNILVKVNGTNPRGAVMLVSHYDSVYSAPGAADDALAVACMLQLMEQMAQNPPENDVYFLYTDGEESGLLGAADFVTTQPAYARTVDVLLNFEARGNKGTLVMFESSANDYELAKGYAYSVPQPVAFSLATAVYELMPNGTDFTMFKNAGYKGLNFAMIQGDKDYHQMTDDLEHLDKDTAWHYYQTVLFLGNHYGAANLAAIQNNQDALYFPLPLVGVVVLPGLLGRVLGFLPLALALVLVVLTLKGAHYSTGKKVARVIGLALLGLLPVAVTLFFFPGSYLFFLPATLFLLADLTFGQGKGKRAWAGWAVLAVAILCSALLFAPLTFLIQLALKLWYVTVLFALLPSIPALVYSVKTLRRL